MAFYTHLEHGLIEAHVLTDQRSVRDRILLIGQGRVREQNNHMIITYTNGNELAALNGVYVIRSEKGVWTMSEFDFRLATKLKIVQRIQDPQEYPWKPEIV